MKKSNGKICVIAEKYSVANEYAKVLKCTRYDSYFESDKYVIIWTDGHLCTLYSPEDYDSKYKVWSVDHLPILPNGFWVKVRPGKQPKVNFIKGIIDREDITSIYIATDSAREGNLIAEYVLTAVNNKKPCFRVMINAMNEKEILNGFKNVKSAEVYKNMTMAAAARDEIDWLIGTNLSRLYSLACNEKYYVGRCKTVILSLLAKREAEIEDFKQKLSYSISAEFKNDKYTYSGILENETKTVLEANKIMELVDGKNGEIVNIERTRKKVPPEQLYNLNDLIRAANRRFGYTAEKIYSLAQKLYEEHKIISYARTDSRFIKASMIDETKMTLNCINIEKFNNKKSAILNLNKFKARCVNDEKVTEHTAIIPLTIEDDKFNHIYDGLKEDERNIYDLIVECFLNNFLDDYEYESIAIKTEVEKYIFNTADKKVIVSGWKNDCEIREIQPFKKGDISITEGLKANKKLSKPKSRYTDDTLFEVLENPGKFVDDPVLKKILKENGIGTNATRALLIRDVLVNGYAIRNKKYIIPTQEGIELVKAIKTEKLLEPFFTAEIEEKLIRVEAGKLDKDTLIKEIYKFLEEHINEIKKDIKPKEPVKRLGNCLMCGTGQVVKAKNGSYGCTNLKTTGCRFYIASYIAGVKMDEDQVIKLLKNKQTDLLNFSGAGGSFTARLIFDGNKTKFRRD